MLLAIAFALHLLAMNLASSGPLLCIWLAWRQGGRGDELAGAIGRRLGVASCIAFVVGGLLGVLVGWLMWIGGERAFFDALGRLPSKVYFGLWELVFYLLCMAIYLAWWWWRPPRSVTARLLHALVAVLAATDLLWHFPPLFAVASRLVQTGQAQGEAIDAGGFRQLMFTAEVFSRTVHVWLASLATAGVAVLVAGERLLRKPVVGPERESVRRVATGGAAVALAASLAQIPVGLWTLVSLSPLGQQRLTGGDLLGTLLMGVSIVAALALMHRLAGATLGADPTPNASLTMTLLVVIIFFMSAALLRSRGSTPAQAETPPAATMSHAAPFAPPPMDVKLA